MFDSDDEEGRPQADPHALLEALRSHAPPIIARIEKDRVVFDVRTLADQDFSEIAAAVQAARDG